MYARRYALRDTRDVRVHVAARPAPRGRRRGPRRTLDHGLYGGAAALRYEALVRGFWPVRYHACANKNMYYCVAIVLHAFLSINGEIPCLMNQVKKEQRQVNKELKVGNIGILLKKHRRQYLVCLQSIADTLG